LLSNFVQENKVFHTRPSFWPLWHHCTTDGTVLHSSDKNHWTYKH